MKPRTAGSLRIVCRVPSLQMYEKEGSIATHLIVKLSIGLLDYLYGVFRLRQNSTN
ncbi:MAG: hypothetical protein UV42_C0031G0009 [Candidatus Magasanikbacteria bacterium GW2011_GWE2_42_7]|uniref:Uncharacterized protein n=1 Tax=Candidatus Magasanikbacteria bacterium GW2011_GWE2_42_7 TaxID=1619052 RepID=A0A0G1BDA9_9BACT|nr:MAG: hypothetical protein UV42_C0031G0009 [Candidatus Magasanikbacteria bacterium GW2011_GWE2_42_7]